MKARLHRVGIVVKDLDAAIDFHRKMLGCEFHRTGEAVAEATGVLVAASWDAGVELVQPLPGSTNPIAQQMVEFLDQTGGGLFAAAYRTDDLEQAHANAEQAGVPQLLPTFRFTQEQLDAEFAGAYTRFEETVFDTRKSVGYTYVVTGIEDA